MSTVPLESGWSIWTIAPLRSAGLPFDRLASLAIDGRAAMDAFLLDDTFRAALTWQNPEAVTNWVGRYVASVRAGEAPALSRAGQREPLIARYAQRYCAKNDTVGFFGPVGWARFAGDWTRCGGSAELRRSSVHVETWAVRALASAWSTDPRLRPHLPVWLDPSCTVDGHVIRRPHRPPLPLTDAESQALRAFQLDLLTRLVDEGVLRVGFRIPLDGAPERHLRRQVEAIGADQARQTLLAVLDELDAATAAVAAAADPEALHAALTGVTACLTTAVGGPVHTDRSEAGRTPVYVDCRRDLDATIGDDVVAGLAGPLAVLLDSARWLAGQVGEVVADALLALYRRLRKRRDVVTLADLQFAAADVLSPEGELLDSVKADFQLRWAEILPEGDADVALELATVRPLAKALFPASGRFWASARVHSPDLMLRRLPDGELRWVLGELHVALNTVENRVFLDQADEPGELIAAVAAAVAPGRVVPVYPSTSTAVSSRTYPPLSLDPPGAYRYWSYGCDDGHPGGAASTPATRLLVSESAGDLIATGDGWAAPVLECFGEFVTALVVDAFRIRPPSRRAPRVELGALTICRRSWRIPINEVDAPTRAADPSHARLRAWAAANGMPRHVFVRTPAEPKPIYVDFAAPVLVDNLARAVRRVPGAWLEVVEMSPGPDELWLADTTGRHYTSELRIVAVDPIRPEAASWDVAV